MRINGVDPNVVERIREQVVQPVVRQLKDTREITEEYKEREQGKGKEPSDDLQKALNQLNQVSQTMGSPVLFRLVEKSSGVKVEVLDSEQEKVVKEVDPDEVIHVVTQVEKLLGLLIDTRV